MIDILHGDCREVLATLPADNVDAVVTDPPYSAPAGGGMVAALPRAHMPTRTPTSACRVSQSTHAVRGACAAEAQHVRARL
jgi:tRNA G10  N-methylase Trm11